MEILNYTNSRCLHICFLLLAFMINTACTDLLTSILWATYNPFFRKLGDSPRTVFFKDQINFICPNSVFHPVETKEAYKKDMLHANIFMVNKQGYDTCNATGGFKIKICNDPNSIQSVNVIILDKGSLPSNDLPAFTIGQLHYLIDTSDGSLENVTNRIGGKCRTQNMKMKLYVCGNKTDKACPNGNKVTDGGWSSWGQCSQSGTQTRQCNNPVPSNGGNGCQGDSIKPCSIITTTSRTTVTEPHVNNNDTITPKKEKRTSVADSLGTLSVGAVVAIFLAVLVLGIFLGIIVGISLARTVLKHKNFNVVKRRKGNSSAIDQFNRNSTISTAKMRPSSTVSNDTTLTGMTNFTSYNDIYDASTQA